VKADWREPAVYAAMLALLLAGESAARGSARSPPGPVARSGDRQARAVARSLIHVW